MSLEFFPFHCVPFDFCSSFINSFCFRVKNYSFKIYSVFSTKTKMAIHLHFILGMWYVCVCVFQLSGSLEPPGISF